MPFDEWIAALELRHLADFRVAEITRALRALSSAYVERRHTVARGGPLDSAGKRAAFALFYAPLHFLAVTHVVSSIEAATQPPPTAIVDVGCGTGAGGAAWAVAAGGSRAVTGIDRHPWAVDEARWTYAHFNLRGRAQLGDLNRLPVAREGSAFVTAYVLNELPDQARGRVEDALLAAAHRGARVLVVEPISRAITPWWDATAERVLQIGGRADEWRLAIDLPPLLKTLDKAAGLDHRVLTFRTLFV